jgi:hypothetical protein
MNQFSATVDPHATRGRPAYISTVNQPRLYTELARWWPLFSGPAEYDEEAPEVLELLLGASPLPAREVLELGSGGGSLSSHFKPHLQMTLSDLSSDMLAVSRELNPEWEHIQGDMRTLDLGRQFQRVLIHDAIMYLTDADSVRAAISNAARHVCPGGAVVIFPDCVRETFAPATEHDGSDAPDGRGLRWLEWSWDPDPSDDTFVTAYSFLGADLRKRLHQSALPDRPQHPRHHDVCDREFVARNPFPIFEPPLHPVEPAVRKLRHFFMQSGRRLVPVEEDFDLGTDPPEQRQVLRR